MLTPKIVIGESSEKDIARKLITHLHLSAVFSSYKVAKDFFVSVTGYFMQNLWNQPWQNKFEFWKLLGPFSSECYMFQSLSSHFQIIEKWKIILRFTVALLSEGFLQRIHMLQLNLKLDILSFPAWSIIRPSALTRGHMLSTLQRSESTACWALKNLGLFCSWGFFSFCMFHDHCWFSFISIQWFQVTFWGWKHNVSEDSCSFLLC